MEEMRCERCGKPFEPGKPSEGESDRAWEIREVRVTPHWKAQLERALRARDCGREVEAKHQEIRHRDWVLQGREEQTDGEEGAGQDDSSEGEGLRRPHVKAPSQGKTCIVICSKCLHVCAPVLFPPTYQPARLTIGVEDSTLLERALSIIRTYDAHMGHVELEQAGETLYLHHYYPWGQTKSYTVDRSGAMVEVPMRRPIAEDHKPGGSSHGDVGGDVQGGRPQ